MKNLTITVGRETPSYTITVGNKLLGQSGKWARKCLGKDAAKIVIVSNPTVFKLYGIQAEQSFHDAGYEVSHFLMKDGERHKTLRSAESVLKFFSEKQLSRTDAVVALGGGVVGDLAGFASAVYFRGVSFLQIPTTLLAMIDSSVGGKTGVNTTFGKNLIGAFQQPKGVLIDISTLRTLPSRGLTAGFCEAVKQGAIGSKVLFTQIADFLVEFPLSEIDGMVDDRNFKSQISDLIFDQIRFKATIVAGDERESSGRIDKKSRKVLNFGHTFAHALEKVTDFTYLRHGEAVGYGILFAAELSKNLALCGEKDVKLLYDVAHRAGPLPRLANIDAQEVFEAFRHDKKNLSGSLQMVLIKGIGKPVILNQKDLPRSIILKTLKYSLQKWA